MTAAGCADDRTAAAVKSRRGSGKDEKPPCLYEAAAVSLRFWAAALAAAAAAAAALHPFNFILNFLSHSVLFLAHLLIVSPLSLSLSLLRALVILRRT